MSDRNINVAHVEWRDKPNQFDELRGYDMLNVGDGVFSFIWHMNDPVKQNTMTIPMDLVRTVMTQIEVFEPPKLVE